MMPRCIDMVLTFVIKHFDVRSEDRKKQPKQIRVNKKSRSGDLHQGCRNEGQNRGGRQSDAKRRQREQRQALVERPAIRSHTLEELGDETGNTLTQGGDANVEFVAGSQFDDIRFGFFNRQLARFVNDRSRFRA